MLESFYNAISGAMIFAGGLICLMNGVSLYLSWRKKRFHSVIPLVGAVLLTIGLWRFDATRRFALFAFLGDWGTLVLLYSLPSLIAQFWPICRVNRLKVIAGQGERAEYVLTLFRKGIFWIDIKYRRPSDWNGRMPFLTGSALRGNWTKEGNTILLSGYSGQRKAILEKQNDGRHIAREMGLPAGEKPPHNTLDGVIFEEKLL
jgi:hypothetical protein